jgi:hypothetical protein
VLDIPLVKGELAPLGVIAADQLGPDPLAVLSRYKMVVL